MQCVPLYQSFTTALEDLWIIITTEMWLYNCIYVILSVANILFIMSLWSVIFAAYRLSFIYISFLSYYALHRLSFIHVRFFIVLCHTYLIFYLLIRLASIYSLKTIYKVNIDKI